MTNILKRFFIFANKIGINNPWIARTFFWKKIVQPCWIRVKELSGSIKVEDGAIAFFEENSERAKLVTELFSDLESKKTFTAMINYRQTGKRKDHVYHDRHTQYFINNFFTYGKNEVLIDCGAFTGNSIESFLRLPKMEYEQIIAFEPNIENYRILEDKFAKKNDKFILLNAGAYSKEGKLYFSGFGNSGSISETPTGAKEEVSVAVKAIDDLLSLKKVTFIKMDVEGAEMEALKGARKTILRDKPRLAISIYHSNEDMLRIAEWIHDLVPEYKLYCRQHDLYFVDTVLYAQIAII
ncbi:MAG: FkbM family methyltransferase [Fibromonadaceae bacterium]|nr:FkbM family methyltransferase [Fibromonadaceae bacterium]